MLCMKISRCTHETIRAVQLTRFHRSIRRLILLIKGTQRWSQCSRAWSTDQAIIVIQPSQISSLHLLKTTVMWWSHLLSSIFTTITTSDLFIERPSHQSQSLKSSQSHHKMLFQALALQEACQPNSSTKSSHQNVQRKEVLIACAISFI